MRNLSQLKTGEKAIVVKVTGQGGFRKRIVEMGFVRGQLVEVILNAPLRDPVKYKIMGYEVSLRRQEAEMITVIDEESFLTKPDILKDNGRLSIIENRENFQTSKKEDEANVITVALVGNPNSGKTSMFNYASNSHERVGNYSGVTVDAKEGIFHFKNYKFKIIDLPGTYSISAYSPEELFVRKYISDSMPDVVVNVIDSSNLERNLYLTTQLIDLHVPTVVALNIYDEFESTGSKLDHKLLGKLLGMPMVPTISKTGKGVPELFETIIQFVESEYSKGLFYRHIHINHGPVIESAIEKLRGPIFDNKHILHKYPARYLAIKLLEKDPEVEKIVKEFPNSDLIFSLREEACSEISKTYKEDPESAIINAKYGFISGALKETLTENKKNENNKTKLIDTFVTHKVWGFPIFFLLMFITFELTFRLGQYPMDWIEGSVEWINSFLQNNMQNGILKDMLLDGIISGVGGVIVFLPNILILYFCISFMEDTGYMARAAFIMDKVMHRMGLHGKSFIPLIMGFGCNVPAIMATRTIESRKNRLITILINPFMSCSARLVIYLFLAGMFFPKNMGIVIFSLYSLGILIAIITAKVFSKWIMKEEDTPFVMELPPYRMPSSKSMLRHTWEKGKQYLKKMGGIILVASIVIWILGYFPRPTAEMTQQAQQANSYIGQLGQTIEPIMRPIGLDWKLGIALISGISAKEVVVSTLNVLYPSATIPIAPLSALCFMIFTLIYFPCIATFVAIRQESGKWRWAVFSAIYTTTLAWIMSFIIFQIGSLLI